MIHDEINDLSKDGWRTLCDDHRMVLFPCSEGFNHGYGEIVLTHMSLMPEDAKGYFLWLGCFLHSAEESFTQKQLLDMPMICEDRFSKVLESGRRLYGQRLVRAYSFDPNSEFYRVTLKERFDMHY